MCIKVLHIVKIYWWRTGKSSKTVNFIIKYADRIYTQRLLMIAFYLYIKPPKLSVADRLETEICLYIYTAPPNTQSVR